LVAGFQIHNAWHGDELAVGVATAAVAIHVQANVMATAIWRVCPLIDATSQHETTPASADLVYPYQSQPKHRASGLLDWS
jgi:hypothetical protein